MSKAFEQLTERFQRLSRIGHAASYLSWDQMVMMPSSGVDARAASLAELAAIGHETLTSPEVEELFADADASASAEERDSLAEMQRVWRQQTCLPAKLVKEKIIAGSRCEHGWRTQKSANDWQGFLANFQTVVDLAIDEAQLRQAANDNIATPYDALLDLHCSGDSKALIDSVFSVLREKLPPLLQEVMEKQRSRKSYKVDGSYDVNAQRMLNESLMRKLGFDFNAGRLDVSMHPFSMGSAGDLRITTRFRDDEFLDAMMATAHETGHASYEGGLPTQWADLPIGQHRNMCIHESQSLLFEKQIFLSKTFMSGFCAEIQSHFPAQRFEAEDLWLAATHVAPEFIRVEANEVTYPLHVLLRYEIESALINGEIQARDIPDLWQQKMSDFLGLDVAGDHARGCMQDIHWSDGTFGYFPSYTVGAVNAAQIFNAIKREHSDWQTSFSKGDVSFVRDWLLRKIWSKGCTLSSQALMEHATGEGTTPDYYLEHLRARYVDESY